jgi:hypothetical protein
VQEPEPRGRWHVQMSGVICEVYVRGPATRELTGAGVCRHYQDD